MIDALVNFAANVRADMRANPRDAGAGGTGLELLIAPRFQSLLEELLPGLTAAPLRVLPEFQKPGFGRPDIALAQEGQPPRAFVELKAPDKSIIAAQLRGHDADQHKRFCELPFWALSNFLTIHFYERGEVVDRADILPPAALDPAVSDARAEALIRDHDPAGFQRILQMLAQASPPRPKDPDEIARVLGHAARLVRSVVLAQAKSEDGFDEVARRVRDEFNETLFARADAGGHDAEDMDTLFASAFGQTLVFGLLLAHEAGNGDPVNEHAYERLPDKTYPLLRATLRALTLVEVRDMLGVAFDIALDAVNSVDPALLAPRKGRDPVLYLYEDFLRVFDPAAVAKYGVYYTPPEIVRLIVAETNRALKEGLGTEGLLDEGVRLLDPACGTGTFLLGAIGAAAEEAEQTFGEGMVGTAISSFAQRMYGFELLVGPYTVAHYRVLREVAGRGGGAEHIPIYLTDTLAPPADERAITSHLDFMGRPIVAERQAADRVKREEPILAIIGNPPYKRLKAGEVPRLVGHHIAMLWDDLKKPVQNAGMGRSLNAFPDLYVAFYRWALWRLFESEGALGRGVVAFITNRNFLTGTGFGGLRKMLRERFDDIRIIDLRGENRGALPATVPTDQNVFNIEVGVCILVATARGNREEPGEADVHYADVWQAGAFTRKDKLALADAVVQGQQELTFQPVSGSGMAPLKPQGFADEDWPGVHEVFTLRSNGIVTYRDGFAYATTEEAIGDRIRRWLTLPPVQAAKEFKETRDRKSGPASQIPFRETGIERVSYRPLDIRYLYNVREYVDFPKPDLQSAWGAENTAFMVMPGGTGDGPAAWAHGFKPDQHSFRGSFGGWVFPLVNHAGEPGHYLSPALMAGLARAYGGPVSHQAAFDVMLAMLSASSFTMRHAHDLESDFPHIPFPAERPLFDEAAAIGARIRALQTFRAAPDAAFRTAKLEGRASADALDLPPPGQAWSGADGMGSIALRADQSLRMTGVSDRVWRFAISGYQPLYRWLKARNGEALSGAAGQALLRGALDTAWRIAALLHLYDEADAVLERVLAATLTRNDFGLPPRGVLADPALEEDEDAG